MSFRLERVRITVPEYKTKQWEDRCKPLLANLEDNNQVNWNKVAKDLKNEKERPSQ